jgi:putative transposase
MGRSSSAVYNLNYHIVFCPKYRKQVLVDDIEVFLKDCFNIIAETNGWKILQMEIMPDHVHIFLSTSVQHSPMMIVKILKGVSGLQLFKKYPALKKKLWDGHLWSPSYYVGTAGNVTSENVKRYIEEQKSNSSTS